MARLDHDGYPTACIACQQPIVKARHDSRHHYCHTTRTAVSWHTHCDQPWPQLLAAPATRQSGGSNAPANPSAGAPRGDDVNHAHHNQEETPMSETTTPEPEPTEPTEPEPDTEDGDEE